MKLFKSIATVGSYTAISRILGFLRDMLIATYLGAGPIADAFFVSFKFPNLFRSLFAEGAFNAAFVPTFASVYASKGLPNAVKVAEQVFSVMFLGLLVFVLLVELNLNWLMHFIAPGFSKTPYRLELAIEFTRVTFPYLLFISLTALMSGVLNSLNRFAASAAAPILLNITMILSLVFFATTFKTPGHTLAWGVLVSGVVQFIWLYFVTLKSGVPLRLKIPKMTSSVKKILKLMGPGVIGAGFMQLNIFIDIVIASFLPTGSVSFLFYADRLNQLPLSLIGIAISTVLLPVLTKQLKIQHLKQAMETQNRCLEFGLLFVVPAAIALVILADSLIHVLFERGKFGIYEAHQTALTLIAFTCGLPAYVLVKVFSTSLFARHDTRTPVITAMISILINLVFNLILMTPFQHVGLASATAIAAWANALMLGGYLLKHNYIELDQRIKRFFPRLGLACFVMAIFIFALNMGLQAWIHGNSWQKIISLGLLVSGGFFVFIASALFFKTINFEEIKKIINWHK